MYQTDRQTDRQTGIPVGNLTSQIFSNIYLNEFDRFVRHQLKPQAYLRYGDDFVIFALNRQKAFEYQRKSADFLQKNLNLQINPKNDAIVKTADGLRFLGHYISTEKVGVDRYTTRSVLSKVNLCNIASYKSLHLSHEAKNELNWRIIKEIDKILDNNHQS